MKKVSLCILGICMFLCLANSAFAGDYTNIYTVGDSGSEVKKATFGWNEKPWLFLELPAIVYDWATTVSTWSWADGKVTAYSTTPGIDPINAVGNKVWLSFSDDRWNEFKKEGNWIINPISILVKGFTPAFITGQTSCTVTPEPVSCTLFLLGGASLAAMNLKRKKRENLK